MLCQTTCCHVGLPPRFRTLRIENPTTPSPPSLRSFLLSVVPSRSTTATINGHGRHRRKEHDQYGHHRHLIGVFGEFFSPLSLSLFKWTRKKRFSCFVLFFFWWMHDLAASGSISQLLLLLQRQRQNTNKCAVACYSEFCFFFDLINYFCSLILYYFPCFSLYKLINCAL